MADLTPRWSDAIPETVKQRWKDLGSGIYGLVRGAVLLASDGTILLGQKTKAGSVPVVLPSDQSVQVAGDLTVSGTALDQLHTDLTAIAAELGVQTATNTSTGDVHAPAVNTAAVVTYAADGSGLVHHITGIAWSYTGGNPTGGNLKVEDGSGNVVFSMDIDVSGPAMVEFPMGKDGTPDTAMIITLAAGGAGVTGKVSVLNHSLQAAGAGILASTADVHAPASATAAVVTYAADATKSHKITGVAWSYIGATPVGGNLKIEDGTDTVFTIDINQSGPGEFTFSQMKKGSINKDLVITLASGGTGVTGKVSILGHRLEV